MTTSVPSILPFYPQAPHGAHCSHFLVSGSIQSSGVNPTCRVIESSPVVYSVCIASQRTNVSRRHAGGTDSRNIWPTRDIHDTRSSQQKLNCTSSHLSRFAHVRPGNFKRTCDIAHP